MFCDEPDDGWGDDCPPCERPRSPVRDAAKLLAALAPIVVATIEHGPRLFEYVRKRLAPPPPPPDPAPPSRTRKTKP